MSRLGSWSRSGEDEERVGMGYEFERLQSAVVDTTEHTWTERVQIIRSDQPAESQAAALQRRLDKAEAALRGLTPPPGPRPDSVHDRLGVGAGHCGDPDRA